MKQEEGFEIGRITKKERGGELFGGDSAEGSLGRQAFVFGYCCPIPLTPWLAAPRMVGI